MRLCTAWIPDAVAARSALSARAILSHSELEDKQFKDNALTVDVY